MTSAHSVTILEDLYAWNSWANSRLIELCDGLSDNELDAPRPIGFGTLRNTLFHILAAEEIWYERWSGAPWRALPRDADRLPVSAIADRLTSVAERRASLLASERSSNWSRIVHYKQQPDSGWSGMFKDLALHVANHGAHHRAQALSYLKEFGRTVPGGLDYSFYRFDFPSHEQDAATATEMRQFGLRIGTGTGRALLWDAELVAQYFASGDWAMDQLLPLIEQLDDAALDHDWNMGPGSIRKTILHIDDAEQWWLNNWTVGAAQFASAPETTSVAELIDQMTTARTQRNQFIASLTAESASRIVAAPIGPMTLQVPVIESLVQLCGHGTHHRAQLINMLRKSDLKPPNVDHIFWQRSHGRGVPE